MLWRWFQIVKGDVLNTESLEKALGGCSGVHINLAGETEQSGVENVARVAARLHK
jgi:hypothetical protein